MKKSEHNSIHLIKSCAKLISISDDFELYHLAIQHGLASQLYILLKDKRKINKQSSENHSLLKQHYLQSLTANTKFLAELQNIKQLADAAKISFIVLKGIPLLSMVYDDIALRPMSDIDILADDENFKALGEILKQQDYIKTGVKESQKLEDMLEDFNKAFVSFQKGDIIFDLHRQINLAGENAIPASCFLKNRQEIMLESRKIQAPSYEIMLLHLLVHIDKHFHRGMTRYAHLVDILLFLKKYNSTLNWDLFHKHASDFQVTAVCNNWLTLIRQEFLPFLVKCPYEEKKYKLLYKNYLKWLKKGDRKNLPVVPPWKRKEYEYAKNKSNRLSYFLAILFPSISYMKNAYGLKNRFRVYLYYPYRLLVHTLRYCFQKKLNR